MESLSEEQPGNDVDHADALERTGYWGQRAAGSIVYSMRTGRFMLSLRSEEVLEPNTWGTWGGACDKGELPEDTALRELVEESGIAAGAAVIEMIPSFVFRHESGFEYHNVIAVVEDEYEPEFDWETADYAWLDLDNLPDNLHPGLVSFLQSEIAFDQVTELREIRKQSLSALASPGL